MRRVASAALSARPQDAARLEQEHAARRGQRDGAAGAVQQAHPQHMFQQLDLPAQRRLGHVHARRGAAEMQFLGGGDKAAKLPQFEQESAIRRGRTAFAGMVPRAAISSPDQAAADSSSVVERAR